MKKVSSKIRKRHSVMKKYLHVVVFIFSSDVFEFVCQCFLFFIRRFFEGLSFPDFTRHFFHL